MNREFAQREYQALVKYLFQLKKVEQEQEEEAGEVETEAIINDRAKKIIRYVGLYN